MLTTPSSSTRDSRGPANRLAARSARAKESVGLDCPTDLYPARPHVRPVTNLAIVGKYVWSDIPAPDAETGFQTKPHSRPRAESPTPKTAPTPVFCPFDQCGTHRIALHIAKDRVQMIVFLDRKRLVGSLIQMAGSDGVPVEVPASNVGRRQSLHETPQVSIVQRPKYQVPMNRHQAIAQNPNEHLFPSHQQHLLEGRIVGVLTKDLDPRVPAVENVENHSSRSETCGAWHDRPRTWPSRVDVNCLLDLSPFLQPNCLC